MLTCLRVREFAIIEQQEIVFEPGLNMVTGETGAGKSIMVDALQLVLGARGRADLVRTGADQADVEALFDVSDDPLTQGRLRAVDIEVEDEIVLHRVNQANGRTRAYVNGKMATAAQLRRLSAGLVDISSQHEHHTLANPSSHLGFLDAFAEIEGLEAQMGAAWTRLLDARTAVKEVEEQIRNRHDREGYLRYQLSELEGIDLEPGQDVELADEVRRLRHSERLSRASMGAEAVLYEQENSVTTQLTRVIGGLQELAAIDPRLEEITQQLDGARVELEEAARVLGAYGRNIHADPERQAELESQLHQLRRLERKYGGSLEAMLGYRQEVIRSLEELVQIEVHLEQRQAELDQALTQASEIARQLSERRKEAAARLADAITAELNELGMGEAQVQVDVAPFDSQSHDFSVDDAPLTSTGIDRVEFLIAPNPGELPKPLAKVASGGEISRALLALKTVLSGSGPAGTYVFDEVDAGVGGAVAEVIGRKLQEIARHHQVICITHLPQIAAFGEAHFFVSKSTRDGRTRSSIRRLDSDGRVKELANMMGGKQHGRSTRKAAEDMLAQAQTGAVEDSEEPTG